MLQHLPRLVPPFASYFFLRREHAIWLAFQWFWKFSKKAKKASTTLASGPSACGLKCRKYRLVGSGSARIIHTNRAVAVMWFVLRIGSVTRLARNRYMSHMSVSSRVLGLINNPSIMLTTATITLGSLACPLWAESESESIDVLIEQVNAQCPPEYPQRVTPLPATSEVGEIPTPQLMKMLGSWSPASRATAARAIATRGDEVVPLLKKAVASEDPKVRAGASSGLSGMVNYRMSNWKSFYPELEQSEAHAKIREQFAALEDVLVQMSTDQEREVRVAALSALASLKLNTPKSAKAVVAMLHDEDVYIASTAMILFEKNFAYDVLDDEAKLDVFRAAMESPFPRSKGHAFRMLDSMNTDAKRQVVPQLLAHLDWQPMRDTMFGAGGQAKAVEILTELKVKELLPRLTTLMDKSMRGPGLFEPCIGAAYAFGKDTKTILPQLRAYDKKLTERIATANSRTKAGLEKRQTKIRELIAHVEGL